MKNYHFIAVLSMNLKAFLKYKFKAIRFSKKFKQDRERERESYRNHQTVKITLL